MNDEGQFLINIILNDKIKMKLLNKKNTWSG